MTYNKLEVVTPSNFEKGLKVRILPNSGYALQFEESIFGIINSDKIDSNGWCSVSFYDIKGKYIGTNDYRVGSDMNNTRGLQDSEGLYYDLYIYEEEKKEEKFKNILSGEIITT